MQTQIQQAQSQLPALTVSSYNAKSANFTDAVNALKNDTKTARSDAKQAVQDVKQMRQIFRSGANGKGGASTNGGNAPSTATNS